MTTHVAVIGGGPAGLAAAVCLGRRGIPYTVYERGDRPLAALRQLDPEMQLLTPASLSRLPDMSAAGDSSYLRFGELIEKFERWRSEHAIQVLTGVEVQEIARAGGFIVRYTQDGKPGEVPASHVVNATGIIAHAKLPESFNPHASDIRWRHSVAVRSADLAAARRLLVVGAGMSAAEVLERWLELRRPDDCAWVSVRRHLLAAPSTILGVDIHYWTWLVEHLPGRVAGYRLAMKRDLIIGRRLVPALGREVARVGPVVSYERSRVVIAGGTGLQPDLIVFATGFRYDVPHLTGLIELDAEGWPILSGAESRRAPGLYLLGVRFGRTIASPYLRGITRDAEYVAHRIAREARVHR